MSERRLMVLGGSSGIGEAAYEDLLRTGIFREARAFGEDDFDVASGGELPLEIRRIRPTDVLYSVGINRLDWVLDSRKEDFIRVMEVNVWGLLRTIQMLDLANQGQPVNLVAVTSDAAWRPMRTSAVYCASKAAMEMVVRVASREYAPHGWRINAVAPGKVADTLMTQYVDDKVLELRGWSPERAEAYELSSTPLGRKISKQEVAQVIRQVMLGPAAQTGEIIAVNGGR